MVLRCFSSFRCIYDLLKSIVRRVKAGQCCVFRRMSSGCACLKGMKLRCLDAGGGDSYVLLESASDKDSTTEKQEELQFFNENGSCHAVVVERHLRVVDLCQILTVKNRVCKDYCWSIIEQWPEQQLERLLEDHEDILAVHRRTTSAGKKYYFRHISSKYDFFTNPACYFPSDMTAYMKSTCSSVDQHDLLQNIIWNNEETPVIFSQANYQSPHNRTTWIKKFFVLKGSRILMSADPAAVKRFLRSFRNHYSKGYETLRPETDNAELEQVTVGFMQRLEAGIASVKASLGDKDMRDSLLPLSSNHESQSPSPDHFYKISDNDEKKSKATEKEPIGEELELFADLTEYEIYRCVNPPEVLGTPAAICLRHTSEEDFTSCLYFGTANKQDQDCWLAAMRLAKYGKQLRENYKSFKGKQDSVSSQKDYQTDNMRSRVAMDFTGSVGRIVEDPKEAKEIERSEGVIWKKRWKEMVAHQQHRRCPTTGVKDEQGAHVNQPWFHENLTRDQAAILLNSLPDKDGIFVVRDSKSKPGCFVLTSKHNGKILHTTIEPLQIKDADGVTDVIYTIDSGTTKFIDIHQLVWFLILNSSNLPTKLLHWSKH